jgi:hypothetical protein
MGPDLAIFALQNQLNAILAFELFSLGAIDGM